METGKLTVEYRAQLGKNETRRLRATGKVPGVCYGLGNAPIHISLDAKQLKKSLDPDKRQNTVIHVTVNGVEGGAKELTVMLRDYQVDALRREVQHVDLLAIDINKDITVEVPILVKGRPIGVVDGGQLHMVHRSLAVSCKPVNIPTVIEVDVSALKIGDALHVKDVTLPAGIKAALAQDETIASVVAPKAEKVDVEAEAAAAAAAEAAAVPGAAPAAGAAAGAAPAAGGKAEAGKPAAKEGGKDKK